MSRWLLQPFRPSINISMNLEVKFSEQQIRDTVCRLGREISAAYRGRPLLLVGVLKGSFVFLADLVRELTVPFEVDFIRARSYGAGKVSSGHVEIVKDLEANPWDRDVIVIEDIADTGLTLDTVVARIQAAAPASVKRCALLVREGSSGADFAGLSVGPGFVVGYGIDYAEQYRGLRDIRMLDRG
jgi:hypoxanthine phosphoribosyltransferase